VFLVLYVNDILRIGNNVPTLEIVNLGCEIFPMKEEAAYILGIKIYRDRSCRLLRLSLSTCLDEILKGFSMQDSKRDSW